jgi:hypothetical protein
MVMLPSGKTLSDIAQSIDWPDSSMGRLWKTRIKRGDRIYIIGKEAFRAGLCRLGSRTGRRSQGQFYEDKEDSIKAGETWEFLIEMSIPGAAARILTAARLPFSQAAIRAVL